MQLALITAVALFYCCVIVLAARKPPPRPAKPRNNPRENFAGSGGKYLTSYKVGVVEYHPESNEENATTAAEANLNVYLEFISEAAKNGVDILIFPEYGLTSLPRERQLNATEFREYFKDIYPQLLENSNVELDSNEDYETITFKPLCSNWQKSELHPLSKISCAAKDANIYVIVNHLEQENCTIEKSSSENTEASNCPPDGFRLFNTNFVYDRQGQIISRCRKSHLGGFDPEGIDIPETPSISVFTTDFNVTFGQLISSDIFDCLPMKTFYKYPDVKDVILTMRCPTTNRFLDPLAIGAGWSHASNSTLIMAGLNDPDLGFTGSGVFFGEVGPGQTFRSSNVSSSLLITSVTNPVDLSETASNSQIIKYPFQTSKKKSENETAAKVDVPPSIVYNIDSAETKLIPENETFVETICHESLCCEFTVETSLIDPDFEINETTPYYRYHAAVFDGEVANKTNAQICSVIACSGIEKESCAQDFQNKTEIIAPVIINQLTIMYKKDFKYNHYFPYTLNMSSVPLLNSDFHYIFMNGDTKLLMIDLIYTPNIQIFGFAGYKDENPS